MCDSAIAGEFEKEHILGKQQNEQRAYDRRATPITQRAFAEIHAGL
jgi:hypothetical protein